MFVAALQATDQVQRDAWWGETAGIREKSVLYRISLAYLRKIARESESSNSSEPAEKYDVNKAERFSGVT